MNKIVYVCKQQENITFEKENQLTVKWEMSEKLWEQLPYSHVYQD